MTELEWLLGDDTGVSSRTIMAAVTGTPLNPSKVGAPYNITDFGRCYRLLQCFPAYRARMEALAKYPVWQPYLAHWGELTALYELGMDDRGFPTHDYEVFHAYLQKMRNAAWHTQ